MKKEKIIKISFGILSILLLIVSIFQLKDFPGGMFFPGYIFGGIMIIILIICCLIIASILKLLFKKTSYTTLLFIVSTLFFTIFYYKIYSPTLKIIVPNGYRGEINLVLSNTKKNILTVDKNGIGYLNKWTYQKTYSKPIVKQIDGKNLESNLVGFNNLIFFATSTGTSTENKETIKSLHFEIVPDSLLGKNQNYHSNWMENVNQNLILKQKEQREIKTSKAVEIKIE